MKIRKIDSIPLEITESALEIFQEVLDCGDGDVVAVNRIKELFKAKNINIQDRTIYRYLEDWRKSGSIKSIIESFNVELAKPGQRTDYILNILTDEMKKSVERNEPASSKIRLADAMHKYIETEIKIEVLRGKKSTMTSSKDESSKVVTIEEVV